jgi:glucose/arabinose dehydrogenase
MGALSSALRPRAAWLDALTALVLLLLAPARGAAARAAPAGASTSAPAPPAVAKATAPAPEAPGFVETVITRDLNGPVSMAIAPDGRVFVCEQAGHLRVVRDGRLMPRPFVTVATRAQLEEGLLGVALDPAFAANHRIYLVYTAYVPRRHNRVVRFTAAGDTAARGSETPILDLDDHVGQLHVGGAIHFGRDRMLYVGTGDNDDGARSQSLHSSFGKLLRIRPDGRIPRDNPFYEVATGAHRAIWARGLRNVFSFDVEPLTGRIFINDVGGSAYEEIDLGIAGGNYGWPMFEGPGSHEGYRFPIYSYGHDSGCAITGGAFYEPVHPAFPREWVGRYFFADFCAAEIRWIDPARPDSARLFHRTRVPGPVDLRVGPDGALYYLARGNAVPTGGEHVPGGCLVRVAPERPAAR